MLTPAGSDHENFHGAWRSREWAPSQAFACLSARQTRWNPRSDPIRIHRNLLSSVPITALVLDLGRLRDRLVGQRESRAQGATSAESTARAPMLVGAEALSHRSRSAEAPGKAARPAVQQCPHHAIAEEAQADRVGEIPKQAEPTGSRPRAAELPRVPIHRMPGVLRALQRGPIPFAESALAGVDAAAVWLPVGHFGVPGLDRAIPMSRTLVVRDARFARDVHTSPDFERGFAFREVARLLGDSLLTLDGSAHRGLRKAFASHFAPRTLDGYQSHLESAFAPLRDAWKQAARDGQAVNVSKALCCANLGFVCHALFSAHPSTETLLALDAALRTCDRAAYRMRLSPINRSTRDFDRALTSLQAFADSLVANRLGAQPMGDFLGRLLGADIEVYDDSGQVSSTRRLTREEVRDEVLDMLLAGYSTTTGAMSFMFDQLARNPTVQDQLRSLNRAARTTGISERVQAYRDAIWTETVRMFPAAVMSPRQAKVDTELHGARIPGGTLALIVPYVSQRDARRWPAPEAFDPRRHLGSGARAELKKDLIAFGHGAHACIGRELSRRMAGAALSSLGEDVVLTPLGEEAKPAGFMLMAPHADVHVQVRGVE